MQSCSHILKGYLIVEVIFPSCLLLNSNGLRMGLICSKQIAAGDGLFVVSPHVVDTVLDHLNHHFAEGVVAGIRQSCEAEGEITRVAVGAVDDASVNDGLSVGLLDLFLV